MGAAMCIAARTRATFLCAWSLTLGKLELDPQGERLLQAGEQGGGTHSRQIRQQTDMPFLGVVGSMDMAEATDQAVSSCVQQLLYHRQGQRRPTRNGRLPSSWHVVFLMESVCSGVNGSWTTRLL